MIEKIYNISTAIIMSIYVFIATALIFIMPKYNIFFSGWWTLLIIVPSLGNLLFQSNKGISLYTLTAGVLFMLTTNNILPLNKCFTILGCLAIIFIGINIVISTIKVPELKPNNAKKVPFYYVLFGSTEEKIVTKFNGGYTKLICGYLNLDLRNAKLEKNTKIKVLSVLGETEILLPDNVEVITSNTNILGGTENLLQQQKNKKTNKIYIESISILGNTKIR
jgi:predicted membrane protein